MDPEIQRLLDDLDRRLAVGDRLSASFARELAGVWKDAERALRQLVTSLHGRAPGVVSGRGAVLLDRVRKVLELSGYDHLVTSAASEAATTLVASALSTADARKASALVQDVQTTLQALREMATTDLLAQGDEIATALWRSLAQHLLTTRPTGEILQDLTDALDQDERFVRTLFDTQVSIFGRQVEDSATADLGPEQPFLYVGPVDDLTREWCLERVGRVFTRAEIDAMDNGQLPNPMLTGGGYNCRHSFLAVESDGLRALVGTTARIPQAQTDVARVEQRKAEKRTKKGGTN